MTAPAPSHLWSQVLNQYKSRLPSEDLAYLERLTDPKDSFGKLQTQLSSSSLSSASKLKNQRSVLDALDQFTSILAVFTAPFPEAATIIWGSVALISERSRANNEARSLVLQVIEDISLSVPQFNTYEELLGGMQDVEDALIKFYTKVLEVFVLSIEYLKRSASWKHRIGLAPAPIKIQRGVGEIQQQKKIVEEVVSAANTTLSNERHKEIHILLSKMQLRATRDVAVPCRMLPYPENPRFRGRLDTLTEIESKLSASTPGQSSFALHGMGGVGKTQLALKYVYDHIDEFPVVLWMQADTLAKLSESYVGAAKQLGLEPEDTTKDADAIIAVLKRWLEETSEEWLIVYDNADKLDVLKPYWPPGSNGCILITSRDPAAIRVAKAGAHVKPLSEQEACTLFLSLLETEDSDPADFDPVLVQECVELLGYLPLAIIQVASYIVERDCTLSEFKEIYESLHKKRRSISSISISTTNIFYEHTLATVWRISIRSLDKDVSRLLEIYSFLDPDSIPDRLLLDGSKDFPPLDFLNDRLIFLDAVSELVRQGLVTRMRFKEGGKTAKVVRGVSVHRLIQESVFHELGIQGQNDRFNDAINILVNAWPTNPNNPFRINEFWGSCALYLPHVIALETRYRESTVITPPSDFIRLLFQASWYLYERRLSEFAGPLLETAFELCKRENNTDPFYAKILTTAGCIAFEMGAVDEGIKHCSEVVDIYRKRDNTNDFLMAASLSDLGWMYTDKGDGKKSIALHQEAVEISKKLEDPGERLDWTTHCEYNLARSLVEMGDAEKALELLFYRGDVFSHGIFSESSQRGALFCYGIGNAFLELGRKKGVGGAQERQKGLDYHMRSLKTRNELCGDNFITASSLHKVGILMKEVGDLKAAETFLEHAAQIFKNGFSADGERGRTLYHLSLVKEDLGKAVEASQLLSEAWQYREKLRGERRDPTNEKDTSGFNKMVIYWHN